MKQFKIMWILGAFMVGLSIQSFSQEVLPEVKVVAISYKYPNIAS